MCAQPCRLPFDLVGEEGVRLQPAERERALCTRDNCVVGDVRALARAGVASLKLEGRMKPSPYVYAVTSAYRVALDALAAGGQPNGEALRRRLKRSFNRGLVDCYLLGESGNGLMSYERSGNRGELVGHVLGFEPEPGFVPRDGQQLRGTIELELDAPVDAGDSLELRHASEPTRFLVVVAPRAVAAGERVVVRVPRAVPSGADVRVTRSVELVCEAAEAVSRLEREL